MANTDVSGTVTDDSGEPVSDATVYLWREDLTGEPQQIATATTDSNGEYSFSAHPDGTGDAESWHAAAKKDGAEQINFTSVWGIDATLSSP